MTDNQYLFDQQQHIDARVFELVRSVPAGRVVSYGSVGAACEPAISGYVCGRILGRASDDVPWWRVVGKDGALPIRKRAPELEERQKKQLLKEGVIFTADGQIDMIQCEWNFRHSH